MGLNKWYIISQNAEEKNANKFKKLGCLFESFYCFLQILTKYQFTMMINGLIMFLLLVKFQIAQIFVENIFEKLM